MHRDSNRPRRVGEVLKRELALIIRQELNHPRRTDVTLTAIDVSPDLRSAKLFFTCLKGEQEAKEMSQVLNQASGFFRHCLRGRVELRGIPSLRFVYDESIERGRKISALIDKVRTDSPSNDTN
ncbi:MAG: ribosome-binding factor A [Gammaproteobacteria bacterium]|nr:MAG: ribosome-binding factor A [Gammaproteobacteria bacterium]